MKKLFFTAFVLLAVACSSEYTPDDKMLTLRKTMTLDQSVAILQNRIWKSVETKGICGARGFWYDKESDIKIFADKITMLAHQRGRQINKSNQGFDDIVVFEKEYYIYEFPFSEVVSINIYDDPLRLAVFPECNLSDSNERYYIVDLFSSKQSNLKFIVFIDNFDETMAAMSILFPNIKPVIK